MNENENFCKAIEQAIVLPCAKEMQLISDEKCDFSSAYRRRIRRLTKDQDKTPHSEDMSFVQETAEYQR